MPEVASTLSAFLDHAVKSEWAICDTLVLDVCDDPEHLEWTLSGLDHPEIDGRDLAISILEQTHQEKLTKPQMVGLQKILSGDENKHLRRKAAFALFKYGDRSNEVIERIKEAVEKDEELKEIALNYLSQL